MAEIFDAAITMENHYNNEIDDISREPIEKTVKVLLNIREEPSLNAKIVRVVKKGTKLTVVDEVGEWSQVGDSEFTMSQYLE